MVGEGGLVLSSPFGRCRDADSLWSVLSNPANMDPPCFHSLAISCPINNYSLLARQEGFEPPTYGLEVRCSIQLSYWRKI